MIGVYIIRHPASGMFYIGSTGDYTRRQVVHMSQLRTGTHTNVHLQAAYNSDPNITWEFIPTNTREEAYASEQSMIQSYFGHANIANIIYARPRPEEHRAAIAESWTDERRAQHSQMLAECWTDEKRAAMASAKMGTTHNQETINKMSDTRTGMTKTPEWVDKIADSRRVGIIVDGVAYRSATEAAIAHNTSPTTVLHRARNPNPKFQNWAFASSE